MKAIQFIFSFLVALLLFNCKQNPHPGYTYAGQNIYYKLLAFNDNNNKIKPGDVITATICSYNLKGEKVIDSYLHPSGTVVFTIDSSTTFMSGAVKNTLLNFGKGDSIILLTDSSRIQLGIVDVQSAIAYKQLKQQHEEFADIHEYLQLQAYITSNKVTVTPVANGLYIIPIVQNPSGKRVTVGAKVEITYNGSFLNGYSFDVAHEAAPLDFTYGNDFQVIKGLEIAIGTMHEGDESKIIIPSHLAYGEKGSSTGIIPAYTTLIYRLKIINVN